MKRDTDLIRKLLFEYEADSDWLLITPGSTGDDIELPEAYHVHLMMDEGILVEVGDHTMRLTAAGHDLLDAIRSDTIWAKTKDAGKVVGGLSLSFLGEVAKGYIKQELQTKLGFTF